MGQARSPSAGSPASSPGQGQGKAGSWGAAELLMTPVHPLIGGAPDANRPPNWGFPFHTEGTRGLSPEPQAPVCCSLCDNKHKGRQVRRQVNCGPFQIFPFYKLMLFLVRVIQRHLISSKIIAGFNTH